VQRYALAHIFKFYAFLLACKDKTIMSSSKYVTEAFNGENYAKWSRQTKNFLVVKKVWKYVGCTESEEVVLKRLPLIWY
jgi:hypothetical protein